MFEGVDRNVPGCGTYNIKDDKIGQYSLSKYRNSSGISLGSRYENEYADPYQPGPGSYQPHPEIVMPKTLVTKFNHARRKSIADVGRDKAKYPPPGSYSTIGDFSNYGPHPIVLGNRNNSTMNLTTKYHEEVLKQN